MWCEIQTSQAKKKLQNLNRKKLSLVMLWINTFIPPFSYQLYISVQKWVLTSLTVKNEKQLTNETKSQKLLLFLLCNLLFLVWSNEPKKFGGSVWIVGFVGRSVQERSEALVVQEQTRVNVRGSKVPSSFPGKEQCDFFPRYSALINCTSSVRWDTTLQDGISFSFPFWH